MWTSLSIHKIKVPAPVFPSYLLFWLHCFEGISPALCRRIFLNTGRLLLVWGLWRRQSLNLQPVKALARVAILKQIWARRLAFSCLVPPLTPTPPNLFLYSTLQKLLRLKILEREIYRLDLLACNWLITCFCLPELVNTAPGLGGCSRL